jgi:hypothetical protein
MTVVTEPWVFNEQNYHSLPQQKLKNNAILDLLETISDNVNSNF